MAEAAHPDVMAAAVREVEGVQVEAFAPPGLVAVTPRKFGDARGFLSETWSRRRFAACGIDVDFVQDNHSHSAPAGTIRGLHFQVPPHDQGKLVRVVRGAVLDVVVDLRHGSPAFGRPVAVELSAANWRQLFVPPGFAHGFVVLSETALFAYKCTDYYLPQYDRGVRWDDPQLAVAWNAPQPLLSAKDARLPLLREIPLELLPKFGG